MYPGWRQAQSGISSEIILSQTNGSTVQASQSPITSNASVLRKSISSLSADERAYRKRMNDQAYRGRLKVRILSHLSSLISFLLNEFGYGGIGLWNRIQFLPIFILGFYFFLKIEYKSRI